ncbi:MAG: hypothetical protein ACLVHO_09775 [Roseburia faecis]
MGGILDKLDEWLRGLLIEGITGNLSGMFDTVNTKVGEIAGEVGQTPLAWNSGVFSSVPSMALILLVKVQSRVFTAKCSEPQVGTSNGMDEGSGVTKFLSLRTET